MPIDQIEYKDAIAGLDMTKEQFIDLCILLGCDYCESIKGIGQATAFKLIKEHGSLDNIVEWIKTIKRNTHFPKIGPTMKQDNCL